MTRYLFPALFACLWIAAVGNSTVIAQDSPAVPPDLTKKIDFERQGDYFLGPTGAKGWMYVNERFMTDQARQILITDVQPNTPAEGILRPGDVILGVGGSRFTSDPRKCLGAAIDEAERDENGGILRLLRWRPTPDAASRQGVTAVVEVPLRVLGTYSEIAPYECPKTQRLLADALRALETREDWSIFGIKALAFLATGEQKYIKLVHDYLHEVNWAQPDVQMSVESGGLVAWGAGYRNLVLTEYYLATGDSFVLPAIREHAIKTAMGQSNGGAWGHGFAWTSQNGGRLHGSLGGYGAVNQAGLPCFLALVLAKKCGVDHPEVNDAIERSRRFFRQFVDKGSIGYGFHRPSLEIHCNGRNGMSANGKNGIASVVFGLLGDRSSQQFFSMLTVSTHNTCEYGHSGNSYSYFWDPLGANYGGPAALAALHRELRWYFALTRQADGSFVNQPLGGVYGRGTLDATVAHVLMMTTPRRAIYLTGKGLDEQSWLDEDQVAEAVEASRWRFADTRGMTSQELVHQLDNWSPIAREWIAIALGNKQEDCVPELLELLNRGNPRARAGACAALGYQGERATRAVPAVAKALHDDEAIVRISAGYALARLQQAARPAVPDLLQAIVETNEPEPMRPTQQALAYSLGYAPGKYAPLYFSGVLPNLSESTNPLQDVETSLVHRAVAKLLREPSGRVRGCGAYALKFFTREDLAELAQVIYDAIETPAPNYAMFGDDPRQHGLDLFERLGIKEGIPLCLDTLEPKRWGQGIRLPHRLGVLARYGAAARGVLPQLQQLRWIVRTGENRRRLEETIQVIESDTRQRPLISLDTLLDERLARDLSETKPAKIAAACRRRMAENPEDHLYCAAGLRLLVPTLGEGAWEDLLAALGSDGELLREAAIQLGAQLDGQRVTDRWLAELKNAQGTTAASILEILARRKEMETQVDRPHRSEALEAAKSRLGDDLTSVRIAALRAVAVLGGAGELPRLIEALRQVDGADPGQRAAAEQAIFDACRGAEHADQVVGELAQSIGSATPVDACSLIRVLGKVNAGPAFNIVVNAALHAQDTAMRQTAFETLAIMDDPRAGQWLLATATSQEGGKQKTAAFTACLQRVIIGRYPDSQRIAVLAALLESDASTQSLNDVLAELAWHPTSASLRLATSKLDDSALREAASKSIVMMAATSGATGADIERSLRRALAQVRKVSENEETKQAAQEWLDRHPVTARGT